MTYRFKETLHRIVKHTLLVKLLWFFGILILIGIVLLKINLKDVYQIFLKTPPLFILLFLVLSISIQFFKAVSYYLLLKESGIKLSLSRVTRIFFASQIMTFLPGGEVGRIVLTKSESLPGGDQKAASAVLSQAFVELVSALVVGLLGSMYFNAFRLPALVCLLILVLLITVILSEKMWKYFMKFPLKIKFLSKYEKSLANIQRLVRKQVFISDTVRFNYSFIKVMLFAFISHLMGGLLIYAISVAYGLNLNIINGIFAFSITILISGLISVIPGGLGFSDGGLIALLVFFGNTFNKSLALAITFRIVGFLFNIVVGSVVFIIYYRPGLKKPNLMEANE